MKKLISLILALIFISALISSCVGGTEMPKPENNKTVLTVGKEKMNYDYVRYVFMNTKADMENGDENYWTNNPDALEELKEAVIETISHNRAIAMLAKEHGVSLSKKDKQDINSELEGLKSNKKSWAAIKKANYMSDYSYVYVQRFTYLWSKAYSYITDMTNGIIKSDDQTVLDDVPKNFRCIRYVFIEYSVANKEEKKELAEAVYDRALSGEDFKSLIENYGDDPTMDRLIDDGYYYTVTSITEEVENAVNELEIGEISPVTETAFGFFIVQRLDIDMEYATENLASFAKQYVGRVFNEMVLSIKNEMKIEYSDFWKNLKISDFK